MQSLSLVALLATLAACTTMPEPGPEPGTATLTGTATYRERIALPPDSRLVVAISDVSLADAPSVTIAQNETATAGKQVPLPFSLGYDRTRIQPGRDYAVSARILDGQGQLAWITDTRTALPPPGQSVEIRLVQVRR